MTISEFYIGGTPPTLVRYQILFTKKGFESAFPENQELVTARMKLVDYSGIALFHFLSEAASGAIYVPMKWTARNYPPPDFAREGKLRGVPWEDLKYLKFYCNSPIEDRQVRDMDVMLGGSTTTLVRYRFLFTKPGLEHAFPEMADTLTHQTSLFEFAGTAIAEFMLRIERREVSWPEKWLANSYPSQPTSDHERMLPMLPGDDWVYLQFNCDAPSVIGNTPCVFIGHGHSLEWYKLKDFLENRLNLRVVEFNSQSAAGLATQERLATMANEANFALLVMTAEQDRGQVGKKFARDNVIHEVGFFQGKLGFKRAIALVEDECSEFSNIHGLGQIRFPHGEISASFEEIRRVLEREGLVKK